MKREEIIPLSYAQKRLWFIDQLMPNSAMYNIHAACRLTGEWSIEALGPDGINCWSVMNH